MSSWLVFRQNAWKTNTSCTNLGQPYKGPLLRLLTYLHAEDTVMVNTLLIRQHGMASAICHTIYPAATQGNSVEFDVTILWFAILVAIAIVFEVSSSRRAKADDDNKLAAH